MVCPGTTKGKWIQGQKFAPAPCALASGGRRREDSAGQGGREGSVWQGGRGVYESEGGRRLQHSVWPLLLPTAGTRREGARGKYREAHTDIDGQTYSHSWNNNNKNIYFIFIKILSFIFNAIFFLPHLLLHLYLNSLKEKKKIFRNFILTLCCPNEIVLLNILQTRCSQECSIKIVVNY